MLHYLINVLILKFPSKISTFFTLANQESYSINALTGGFGDIYNSAIFTGRKENLIFEKA